MDGKRTKDARKRKLYERNKKEEEEEEEGCAPDRVRAGVYLFALPEFVFFGGGVVVRGGAWKRKEQVSNACVCERITLGV